MMTRRKKRSCSNPKTEEVKSESIPLDLVYEILLRLPLKSIARFRCVSKLWQSTLRGSYFTDSFFTISASRPKILFTCVKDGETVFFSSPQPQNLSPIVANIHISFPINRPSNICRPVRGFVCCLQRRNTKGMPVTVPLICNPSTRQFLALPKVKTRRQVVINFFGFDLIEKKFKVLCMTRSYRGGLMNSFEEHQVITLEIGKKPSRKMIKCDIRHHPFRVERNNSFRHYHGICINGVLYYFAVPYTFVRYPDIVCFEFGSEKFRYIKKADHGMNVYSVGLFESTLVNYKGKLAKLQPNTNNGICSGIQLWVLEDAEKHEWSSYTYVLPPMWRNIFEHTKLCFAGTTDKGEFVFSPDFVSNFFYLLYYSPERNIIDKVEIKGMETFKGHRVYTILDHVEDVKLV